MFDYRSERRNGKKAIIPSAAGVNTLEATRNVPEVLRHSSFIIHHSSFRNARRAQLFLTFYLFPPGYYARIGLRMRYYLSIPGCNDFAIHFATNLLTSKSFLYYNRGRSSGRRSIKCNVYSVRVLKVFP